MIIMKLDIDCIRDTLAYMNLEESPEDIIPKDVCDYYSSKYTLEQVQDTMRELYRCECITGGILHADNRVVNELYRNLTLKGFDLLNDLNDKTTSAKVKKVLSGFGSFTLDIVLDVLKEKITGTLMGLIP